MTERPSRNVSQVENVAALGIANPSATRRSYSSLRGFPCFSTSHFGCGVRDETLLADARRQRPAPRRVDLSQSTRRVRCLADTSYVNPAGKHLVAFSVSGHRGVLRALMLLTYPGSTVVILVTFLGFYWLFTGIMSLVRVFVDRSVPLNRHRASASLGPLMAVKRKAHTATI
jgi:hypothetical protein